MVNQHLSVLAKKFPETKFVKAIVNSCIEHYHDNCLPTIFVYKNGQIEGKFIGVIECGGINLKLEGNNVCFKMFTKLTNENLSRWTSMKVYFFEMKFSPLTFFSKIYTISLVCMRVCLKHFCVPVLVSIPRVHRSQKQILQSLELELQPPTICHVSAGIRLSSHFSSLHSIPLLHLSRAAVLLCR